MTTEELVQQAVTRGDVGPEELQLLNEMAEIEAADSGIETEAPPPTDESRSTFLPMRRADGKSPFLKLRRSSTGDIRIVPRNMLASKLKQRLADGRRAWVDPTLPWQAPSHKREYPCYLGDSPGNNHPEHEKYLALGYAPCGRATGMPTSQARTRHMGHKHKDAWADIQKLHDFERQETRDSAIARGIAEALRGLPSAPMAASMPVGPAEMESPTPVAGGSGLMMCECGQEVASPYHPRHRSGKRHQRWAARRK
jgi:hypothetical protein